MIQNRATGLYLDGMGRTSNGSICGQWSSSSSNNQQWTQETVGSNVKFKNRATGLYLDGMGSTAQWLQFMPMEQQQQYQPAVADTVTPLMPPRIPYGMHGGLKIF